MMMKGAPGILSKSHKIIFLEREDILSSEGYKK